MSQVIAETIGKNDYAVLSGPSFAHDVAGGKPTAVVVAGAKVEWIQKNLSGPTLRLYTSDDVTGVELGGAMKNIMAIAAGVSDGLGLGESTRSALITRALTEMVRLGERLGGKRETFFGLSGLGDLVLTCGGRQSRNHQVGERLARGEALDPIAQSMNGVAEGVRNTRSFHQIALKDGIDAPIIAATHGMLYEGVTPAKAIENLMGRQLKGE
jgi:glycerol-3-phosphate dehydrogenase (NAD(P)+)